MTLLRNFLTIFWLFSFLQANDYKITDYRNKFDLANQSFFDGTQGPNGQALVLIDPLNESGVIYLIKLLKNSNRLSEAAEIYKKFNLEYYNLFGKDYKAELNDILA